MNLTCRAAVKYTTILRTRGRPVIHASNPRAAVLPKFLSHSLTVVAKPFLSDQPRVRKPPRRGEYDQNMPAGKGRGGGRGEMGGGEVGGGRGEVEGKGGSVRMIRVTPWETIKRNLLG